MYLTPTGLVGCLLYPPVWAWAHTGIKKAWHPMSQSSDYYPYFLLFIFFFFSLSLC